MRTEAAPPRGRDEALSALVERLLARSGRGAKYGLDRIQEALDDIGRPERELDVVHVAGTNGKGSVCAMLDAMAGAAGLSVGVFTSPHLCRLNERIRLGGEPIDDARFAAALRVALDAEPPVTFFEAMTIVGFVAMRDAGVDLAVFEVGLGGRLDATNVIPPPQCAVITSIGRDHTRLLGEEPAAIAREKAGIIKPGAPLVVGAMVDEARDAILEVAREREAGAITVVARSPEDAETLAAAGVDVIVASERDGGLMLRGAVDVRVPRPALAGPHQRHNAAAAAAAAAQLRGALAIDTGAIAAGIASARWPGRLERLERDGVTILLDCAHNMDAALALDAALGPPSPERTHLVFGALGDKGWPDMLRLLGPRAVHRYYCTPLSELAGRKPAPPAELSRTLPGRCFPSKEEAVDAAIAAASPGDTVLVTGSIFLVGGVRSHLTGDGPDPAIPL